MVGLLFGLWESKQKERSALLLRGHNFNYPEDEDEEDVVERRSWSR